MVKYFQLHAKLEQKHQTNEGGVDVNENWLEKRLKKI